MVFWDHDAGEAVREAADFVEWLSVAYRRSQERRMKRST